VSLQHTYPRLPPGAVCVIDDYCDPSFSDWNFLPGVKKACDEFFADKPEKVAPLYAGFAAQGYFRKL
jgi:O-methyltransferase